MIILHCLKKEHYDTLNESKFYGKDKIKKDGFIHCSDLNTFVYVSPNFMIENSPLVLLLIDTEKVEAPLIWEDFDGNGICYPHLYGELNMDSVVAVVPFLKDNLGNWIKNEEIKAYEL